MTLQGLTKPLKPNKQVCNIQHHRVHQYSSDLIEELLLQQKRRRMQLHRQDANQNVPQMEIIMDAMS